MKTLLMGNMKGGVGKSQTAHTFGTELSQEYGKRVLMVDSDPQGNISDFFNRYDPRKKSLLDLYADEYCETADLIQHTDYERLDIIPANIRLMKAEIEIPKRVECPMQLHLRDGLAQIADLYDYAIIDGSPSMSLCTINAIVAADEIIMPVMIGKFEFDGVSMLLEQARMLEKRFDIAGQRRRGIVTMLQANTMNAEGFRFLYEESGLEMFETKIRRTVAVAKANDAKLPINTYHPTSTAALDYRALVAEFMRDE